jgi:hypothetical protein
MGRARPGAATADAQARAGELARRWWRTTSRRCWGNYPAIEVLANKTNSRESLSCDVCRRSQVRSLGETADGSISVETASVRQRHRRSAKQPTGASAPRTATGSLCTANGTSIGETADGSLRAKNRKTVRRLRNYEGRRSMKTVRRLRNYEGQRFCEDCAKAAVLRRPAPREDRSKLGPFSRAKGSSPLNERFSSWAEVLVRQGPISERGYRSLRCPREDL